MLSKWFPSECRVGQSTLVIEDPYEMVTSQEVAISGQLVKDGPWEICEKWGGRRWDPEELTTVGEIQTKKEPDCPLD